MTTLYDSIDPTKIPKDAQVVAGYVGGTWPTFAKLPALFPNALLVSIAINASEDADVLDVEQGDATPAQAPAWVIRQRSLGRHPTVYCSRSPWADVQRAFDAPNVPQPDYWIADYTSAEHLLPGSVATQWTDAGPYDISVTNGTWPRRPISYPVSIPDLEQLMALASSPTDALNAYIRDRWATYRTDTLTVPAVQYLQAGYNGPWKGSLDFVLACIIDNATITGHLRPQFAGAA